MPFLKQVLSFFMLGILIAGCSSLGLQSPFPNDPLTGGVDAKSSALLGIPIPSGLQRYPSHGFIATGASGGREGLETFRGYIDGKAASLNLFNTLRQHGWELKLSLRKGDRSVTLYQRDKEFAIITFHRQGMLTILEIWVAPELPPGSVLSYQNGNGTNGIEGEESDISLPGEEYGPLDEKESRPARGAVEQWGGSKLEEREL